MAATLLPPAQIFGVSKSSLSCWMKDLALLKEKCESAGICLTSHTRPISQLAPVHDKLLSFIEEYHCMGFLISKQMLMFQASRISEVDSDFCLNTSGGRLQAISHGW